MQSRYEVDKKAQTIPLVWAHKTKRLFPLSKTAIKRQFIIRASVSNDFNTAGKNCQSSVVISFSNIR